MNPIRLTAVVVFCASILSAQSNVVFYERFDDNGAGWTVGQDWDIAPAQASTGNPYPGLGPDPDTDADGVLHGGVAGVNVGGSVGGSSHGFYWLTSPVIDTSGLATVTLHYRRWLNTVNGLLGARIDAFNGTSWVAVWAPTGTTSDSNWTNQVFDVTAHSGPTFRVRFGYDQSTGSAFQNFPSWNIDNVAIFGPASNDTCASASPLQFGDNYGSHSGATPTDPQPVTCANFTTTTLDVWYTFTPTQSHLWTLSRFGGAALALYSGSDCSMLTQTGTVCGTTATFTNVALAAGTQYFLRVAGENGRAHRIRFTYDAPNDVCSQAIPLAIGTNLSPVGIGTGTNPNPTGCSSFGASTPDTWFTYTAVVSGTASFTQTGAVAMALYSGADCSALTAVGSVCGAGPFTGVALTAGTRYFLRVAPSGTATYSIAFAFDPANDVFAGAVSVFDGINPASPSGLSGLPFSNEGAGPALNNTALFPGFACAPTPRRDVFFSYTATGNSPLVVSTCTPAGFAPGTLSDSALQVWAPSAVLVGCSNDVCGQLAAVTFTPTAGTTYTIRVASATTATPAGSFYLTILPPAQLAQIGAGCPATTVLAASAPPVLGGVATITLTAQPLGQGLMLYSLPNLGAVYSSVGSCTLYLPNLGTGVLFPLSVDGAGTWNFVVPFPTDPGFAGVGVDVQAVIFGSQGMQFSNALRLLMGI